MDKIKKIKPRNLLKINTKPRCISPFSIEKIASSLNCGNLINSIKYKYIDPLIKRKKTIISLTKKHSKRIQDKLDEEMYSARKIKYRKYKLMKESLLSPLSYRGMRKENIDLKNENSKFILPLIKNKKINESYHETKKEENDFISTSGMLNRRKLNDNKKTKITVNSLINIIRNKKPLIEGEYKSWDNKRKINLKLNYSFDSNKNNNSKKKIKLKRKLTKFGLLTNLYNKYSSVNNININKSGSDNKNNRNKLDNSDENSSNNSYDLGKELMNNNYAGDSTFLTKLKNINDKIDISKIINKHNNLIWSIKRKNNKIITKDNKIYINCLLSKVQNEINIDRILYRNNGKTIYELDKDYSYKRIKKFETIITKFLRKKE